MEEAGAQSTSSAAANEAQERENMTNWEVGQRGRDAVEAAVNATHGCNASTSIAAAEVEVSIAPASGEATHEKPAPADTATAKEPPSLGLGLSDEALPEVGEAIPAAEQEHESGAPAAEPASPSPAVAINDGTSEGVAAAAATSSTCKEYTIEEGKGATLVLNEVPTHTSPRVTANGTEWVHLYDVEERAPYWFCEATQVSQWEEPGTAGAAAGEAGAAAGAEGAARRLSQTELLFSESQKRHSRPFSFRAVDSNFDFAAFDTELFATEAAACEVKVNSDHTVTAMAASESEARKTLAKLGLPKLECMSAGETEEEVEEEVAAISQKSSASGPSKTPRTGIPKGMLGAIPDPAEAESAKREGKRVYTVQEIIITEETYSRRLKATWEVYVVPLRQVGILKAADIDCMFFMWESIMGLHKDFYAALKREQEADQLAEKVGLLFSQYSHLFKMYQPYLNNFGKASDLRTTLLLESKHFHEFCQGARKHAQCDNQSLMELMCEPIQRIPRYKLLLQQLIKYTPDASPHKEGLEAALARISEVAVAIDHGIHESNEARKNHEILVDIMMSFTWNTRINLLDDPSRYLIMSGVLDRQTRSKVRPYMFWLLTDKLIYGEEVPGLEGNYIIHRDFPLDACRASVPPPRLECANRERALFIESSQKSFIVWAETADKAKEWNNAIIETVATYRNKVSAKSGGEGIAPMWTPNNATASCECCDTEFGMLTFKHHCRKCGAIVCASCSSFSFLLPNVDKHKAVRVCDSCFMTCVEESDAYSSLDDYFEKKRIAEEATVVGSLKNSIGGLFGLRRSGPTSPNPTSPSSRSTLADSLSSSTSSRPDSRPASANLS